MIIVLTILLLLALFAFGVPVGFSLAISGCFGLIMTNGFDSILFYVGKIAHTSVANFTLTTVPMFILMAEFASKGKLANQLFTVANRFLGYLPGGMAIATVMASAGFGAMCGTSSAAAATMSSIAVPEMFKIGYKPRIATGIVAVAGTLAIMIPPSVPLVVYGVTTEMSIGKLLIAGIIPGIITAGVYSLGIICWTKLSSGVMPTSVRYAWKERIESLKGLAPFIILVLAVIGGMYSGVATPTEIAALGALFTLIICLLMRSINLQEIVQAIEKTVLTTTMIYTILVGAMIFGYYLTTSQVAQKSIAFVDALGIPGWGVMAIVCVLYLIMGCFMDTIAILLITLPLTFPLVTSLGYDGLWFGIIVVKLCEIGLCTPPVGLNIYVTSGTTGVPLEEVFKGVGVMLAFEAVTLLILLAFPSIVTFLPSLMKS
ncbi:TRAP-type C4-dicarboxylate transport system [Desulfocucumis palustris]|uniref:TRAP-type C4-dicarboxylate transport system n=1 Tax=Desulfocucumis palustris TaxID=1898651 RepID=A0A2L2X8Y5_9FIRM|nr:TRAP transporter large permease [Desulfocucumis palustris]GBF32480.1 TRAP-type C4-dicarboxylate transport system [Desulfocucumis palustris]